MRIALLCLLVFCSIAHADDVYVTNGFVLQNAQAADTANSRVNILEEGISVSIPPRYIVKIDKRPLDTTVGSTYQRYCPLEFFEFPFKKLWKDPQRWNTEW
jgi:hypothetical protein